MKQSEKLDLMYKQADAFDDYQTKVKNGDYNFSNKQKVITGVGALLGGLGAGLHQNHVYNELIRNAQERQEKAKTDRSRKIWENTEARLRKQKKLGVGISAAGGAIMGGYVPFMILSSKNEKRQRVDRSKAWGDTNKAYNDAYQQYQQYRQQYSNNGYQNRGYGRAQARDISSDFSSFGIKPEQFTTKAEFNKWHKTQAKKYHPDLNPNNPDAADMMKKVNDFYDNAKKSDWFSKLAFMLENGGLEKRAALGAALSAGAKMISSVAPKLMSAGSKVMSSNIGRAALNSAAGGAVNGAILGAVNSRPETDGKSHWIKNSLRGAAAGAGMSAAIGAAGAVARTPNFGARLVSGAKNLTQNSLPSTPGSNPAPIVKPASTSIV